MGRRINGQINGQPAQAAEITVEEPQQTQPLIIDSQGTVTVEEQDVDPDLPDQ